nr:hypothetical protein C1892_25945 [Pseudomonas sp. MPBD7-1]
MGAGLLAKRPVHPTSMQADPTPSRASPLPQLIGVEHIFRAHWRSHVGASLRAMTAAHPPFM